MLLRNRLLKEIKGLLLKTSIFYFKKFVSRSVFGEFQLTHITEFSKFLLQLKSQRSGSKTVSGFSIIFILKGVMTF